MTDIARAIGDFQALMEIVQDFLKLAQLREWPDSRIMTFAEVKQEWLIDGPSLRPARRAVVFVLLSHPYAVFYECGRNDDGTYKYRGARWGVAGEEYISGMGK